MHINHNKGQKRKKHNLILFSPRSFLSPGKKVTKLIIGAEKSCILAYRGRFRAEKKNKEREKRY